MNRRAYAQLGILVLLATVPGQRFAYGQSLNCSNRLSQVSAASQKIKIILADVEFSGENPLSNDARGDLLKHIKQLDLSIHFRPPRTCVDPLCAEKDRYSLPRKA